MRTPLPSRMTARNAHPRTHHGDSRSGAASREIRAEMSPASKATKNCSCTKSLLRRELRFDGRDHFGRIGLRLRREAGDEVSVAIEEELFEVPLDRARALRGRLLGGDLFVERAGILAID